MEDSKDVRGLKLDPKKSKFAKEKNTESSESFNEQVDAAHERKIGYQQEMFDLGRQFLDILKDKTLVTNKGPITLNLEKEVLGNLIQFGIRVNADDQEPEGMGSIGLLTLMFKCVLVMRDNHNQAEYNAEQADKRWREIVKKLESRIAALEENTKASS